MSAIEELTTANIGKHLIKKYPGHLWSVQVEKGLITIQALNLSGKWGFHLHENKIDNDYKVITRAAGQLLERYGLTRGAMKEDEVMNLQRDFKGEVIHDTAK